MFFSPYAIFVPVEAKFDAAATDDLLIGEIIVENQHSLQRTADKNHGYAVSCIDNRFLYIPYTWLGDIDHQKLMWEEWERIPTITNAERKLSSEERLF